MNFAQTYFPSNVPLTGVANRVASPVAPVVATKIPNQTPTNPSVGVATAPTASVSQPAVASATHNTNPYNVSTPIGVPNLTPLATPLGVSPQFTTPTAAWTYDYGNGQ
jgi:hypothetical protein